MTLFRKVFQNQSRPATEDETLDEDAIREAFMVSSDDRVLPLDPFAVSKEEDAADAPSVPPSDDVEEAQLTAEDAPDAEPDLQGTEAESSDDEADGGADIAAVLAQTRMMEQKPVRVEPSDGPEVTEDDAPQSAAPMDGADAVGHEQPETAEDNTDAPADDTSDVVAFAKRQLELSGASDMTDDATAEDPAPVDLSGTAPDASVPAPMAGRAGRRAGRVKTRLLGFNQAQAEANDPIGTPENATAKPQHEKFPVGWLVVVEGPGVGHSFSIFTGASMIGRGDDQVIKLDFGDNSISRHNHAAIAYDEEQNKFYIGHGGKSNIIRLNARPVLSTEELHHADLIRIGETTLRFVALCGSDFKWDLAGNGDAAGL